MHRRHSRKCPRSIVIPTLLADAILEDRSSITERMTEINIVFRRNIGNIGARRDRNGKRNIGRRRRSSLISFRGYNVSVVERQEQCRDPPSPREVFQPQRRCNRPKSCGRAHAQRLLNLLTKAGAYECP